MFHVKQSLIVVESRQSMEKQQRHYKYTIYSIKTSVFHVKHFAAYAKQFLYKYLIKYKTVKNHYVSPLILILNKKEQKIYSY